MNILITGATGYFGRHIVPELLKLTSENQFMFLSRDISKSKQMFPSENCQHVSIDEMEERIPTFQPEVIIHWATLSTSRCDYEIIAPMIQANIQFGVRLLSIVSALPCFKLFVNTGSFAEFRLGTPQFKDAYLYTATKSAFRHFVDFYADAFHFRYINVVPYTVYGGEDTQKKMIDYIRDSLSSDKPVEMTLGEQVLDFIHISDIALFYRHLIEQASQGYDFAHGQDAYLGTGRGTTIREVARMVEQVSGQRCNIAWGARAYRPLDVMHAIAPIQENVRTTSWKAQITIEAGIKKYLDK